MEIHHRANLIRARMYEVVDQAEDAEERAVLADEACRAMWLAAGEKHFGYHPNRGLIKDDWTIA